MVSNCLPQVLNKRTAAQNMSILLCVFIKELGHIVKNHTMTIISYCWPTKIYFLWWHLEISSILFFSKVSWSAEMMETFSDKHRSQRFEPHWYGEVFLWISHDRLLSRPWSFKFHTCFDNSVSFMHSRCLKDFVWLLYRVLNSPSSEVP